MDQDQPENGWELPASRPPLDVGPWLPHHAPPPSVAHDPDPEDVTTPRVSAPPRARVGVVALVCAAIGALVGGAIAGGVVAALDHHDANTVAATPTDRDLAARPSTALSKPGDIRSILARVEPAVVRIDVTADPESIASQSGTGTGFVVASDGVIVTNAHVVNADTAAAAGQLVVTLSDGDSVRGRVIGEDRAQDLAVVKIDRTGLPTVQLGESDSLQVGDAVVAIGNALGIAGSPTVTSGIVSGLGRTVHISSTETLIDAIQTDAAINPGNSGGPLVDVKGRVIGINTAIADPSAANNIGFAISISSAEPVLDDLRAGKTPRVAFMGVSTETLTPSIVRLRHLDVQEGAYVAVVTPGEGAARAGLRKGDVMIEVDGKRVSSNDDVVRIVREHRPGESLRVVVRRDGARKRFEVTLGELPNA